MKEKETGIAIITVLMLIGLMGLMLTAYHQTTKFDLQSLKTSSNYETAFFAAEAGLNARAETFRQHFQNFGKPTGTSPTSELPCEGGDNGSGDFRCINFNFGKQSASTYGIQQFNGEPKIETIPAGEAFGGLNSIEYSYDVISLAKNPTNEVGAILALRFNSRVVPIFQFAAFFDKDLEITNTQDMLIGGPVHVNGDVYLSPQNGADLVLNGQLTLSGDLYRGKKRDTYCAGTGSDIWPIHGDRVYFADKQNFMSEVNSANFTNFNSNTSRYGCSGNSRRNLSSADFSPWNNNILFEVDDIEIPNIESTNPGNGNLYWDQADLRVELDVIGGVLDGIRVKNLDGSINGAQSLALENDCAIKPLTAHNDQFFDLLRHSNVTTLEVDLFNLLQCLDDESIVSLDDTTQGGHILYLSVNGPDQACTSTPCYNNYGVRLKNAENLIDLSPRMKGLTIVSDQPVYLMGNFNKENSSREKISASIYGDALTVLSERFEESLISPLSKGARKVGYRTNSSSRWSFTPGNVSYDKITQEQKKFLYDYDHDDVTFPVMAGRYSSFDQNRGIEYNMQYSLLAGDSTIDNTTINAALVFGTLTTGGSEGSSGQNGNPNSAGLNNYPRLLENWSGQSLIINGSFISLRETLRAKALSFSGVNAGIQTSYHYLVPTRLFTYDEAFDDPENLPPGSLNFVYLRQVFFSRDFKE